jgi:hypothetical protein
LPCGFAQFRSWGLLAKDGGQGLLKIKQTSKAVTSDALHPIADGEIVNNIYAVGTSFAITPFLNCTKNRQTSFFLVVKALSLNR